MPRLNVIMSVYNQESFLSESIESVLNQTFDDFELIVVNDGSKDRSLEILNSYKDKRVRILNNIENKGLIYSLNSGFSNLSDCEYVVRMDSDDIAMPTKFQRQYDFLNEHRDIGLLGTGIRFFGDGITESNFYYPETNKKIVSTFLYYNPFAHPTVMIRKSELTNDVRYDYDFPKYEDYALWMMMSKKCKFHNLNEVLLKYRRHVSNVTNTYNENIKVNQILVLNLLKLYRKVTDIKLLDSDLDIIAVITNQERYVVNPKISTEALVNTVNNLVSNGKSDILDVPYMKRMLMRYAIIYLLKVKRKADSLRFITMLGISGDTLKVGSSILLSKTDDL